MRAFVCLGVPVRSWSVVLVVVLASLAVDATAGQPTKRPSDEELGRTLYTRHCQSCHGPGNHGDGPATAALVVPVPDLAGKVTLDKATVDVVQNGRGPMPGYEASLNLEETRSVLRHMTKAHEAPSEPAPAPAPADAPAEGGEAGPG